MNSSLHSLSFRSLLEDIRTFCKQHRIGFGPEDKDEDDDSKYTIAYETVNEMLYIYIVEDETEYTDQLIIDQLRIIKDTIDVVVELEKKCKQHKIIS